MNVGLYTTVVDDDTNLQAYSYSIYALCDDGLTYPAFVLLVVWYFKRRIFPEYSWSGRILKGEPLGIVGAGFIYRPDVLPVSWPQNDIICGLDYKEWLYVRHNFCQRCMHQHQWQLVPPDFRSLSFIASTKEIYAFIGVS